MSFMAVMVMIHILMGVAREDVSYIINNYDTDGGYDILELLNSPIENISAVWQDNDLVITSEYDNSATKRTVITNITLTGYRLKSDYQIDEFYIGYHNPYTGDECLAAMGLTV